MKFFFCFIFLYFINYVMFCFPHQHFLVASPPRLTHSKRFSLNRRPINLPPRDLLHDEEKNCVQFSMFTFRLSFKDYTKIVKTCKRKPQNKVQKNAYWVQKEKKLQRGSPFGELFILLGSRMRRMKMESGNSWEILKLCQNNNLELDFSSFLAFFSLSTLLRTINYSPFFSPL